MLGLTLALRLRQLGHAVTILEASPTPGGLVAETTLMGQSWDRFHQVMVPSDRHLGALLKELGIPGRVRWQLTTSALHSGRKAYPFSTLGNFLACPLIGPVDKLRVCLTIQRALRTSDAAALENIGAGEWLRRWSGAHAYETIWLPFLRAKLGENHSSVSAEFARSMIARMYGARRAAGMREVYGYVDGGYRGIVDSLCGRLAAAGAHLETGASVARVIDAHSGATVLLHDGRVIPCDHVVVTTPTPVTARLCPQLTDDERARLERVTYQGVLFMSLLLRRTLGDFYMTHIAAPGAPFGAVIQMTALVPAESFGERTLVYLPRYVSQDDVYWALSDSAIRNRFLSALGSLYPELATRDVVACEISRVRHVLALPTPGYSSELLPPLTTSRPRIHLVNSAQNAQGTLTVNEAIALANRQAAQLHANLAQHGVRVHTPVSPVAALDDKRDLSEIGS